ncbi:MAG: exodeoxyribonuclease VII large subunit [Ilumatobacteraceae bacterium]|jgi:exodeoxyribonuclease VII large subunit|nr:exodeoxyribonuclease VII large subunit [Ilumatobacteraceae bacterium]
MPMDIDYINGVPAVTVGQFSEVVNQLLSSAFDGGVWIEGEIEGLKKPNPHLYFSLIENVDGKKAQANINLFAGNLRAIQTKLRQQGLELKDGLRVRLYGIPDYYAPFGKLSIKVEDIDTQFTVGDVAAKREALLKALLEKGVHKLNKRRPVPLVPLRLGVVSSSQAAGWADAERQLLESGYGFSVSFIDVRVQGDDAPPQVVAALNTLSRRDDIDVVLLMRGGGSKSDLAAFDDERIALAISQCRHPVFTGLGHQIDTSIADVMAHTAHKTPTACAQAVIALVEDFLSDLASAQNQLRLLTGNSLLRARNRVALAVERLTTRPRNALERQKQILEMRAATVRLLDPAVTMARGWSITRDSNGNVVRSTDQVSDGDVLVTSLAQGSITSRVEGKS